MFDFLYKAMEEKIRSIVDTSNPIRQQELLDFDNAASAMDAKERVAQLASRMTVDRDVKRRTKKKTSTHMDNRNKPNPYSSGLPNSPLFRTNATLLGSKGNNNE